MNNYGEELGYWYLRLNGFFPLTNFVLHQRNGRRASDCDLLAVRPPYVDEAIGGERDMDTHLRKYKADGRSLGVWAEVRTGDSRNRETLPDASLPVVLKRLGFQSDCAGMATALQGAASAKTADGDLVIKVVIAPQGKMPKGPFVPITIEHVNSFILDRMAAYEEKDRDRHFFPSHLIQYMIRFGRGRGSDLEVEASALPATAVYCPQSDPEFLRKRSQGDPAT